MLQFVSSIVRAGEIFFLQWGVVWVSIMAYIVASRVFEV